MVVAQDLWLLVFKFTGLVTCDTACQILRVSHEILFLTSEYNL